MNTKFDKLLSEYAGAHFVVGDWRGTDYSDYVDCVEQCEQSGKALRAYHASLLAALRTASEVLSVLPTGWDNHKGVNVESALRTVDEVLRRAE